MLQGKLDKAYDEGEIDKENDYRDQLLGQIQRLREEERDDYEVVDRDVEPADILRDSDGMDRLNKTQH